jgi:hypothetical protein
VLDLHGDQHVSTSKGKGKRKTPTPDDSDGEAISPELDVHMDDTDPEVDPIPIVPLPQSESIETLRAKLHAKIEVMRIKKRGDGEGNSKDELLEERRLQRAAMRERRRKETKEKIRKEKESRGKTKEKPNDTAPPTKVSFTRHGCRFILIFLHFASRASCSSQTVALLHTPSGTLALS